MTIEPATTENDDHDNLIWHYTSAEGLYGIIGTEKHAKLTMHCSNILFMNDKTELYQGFNLIESYLEKTNEKSNLFVEVFYPIKEGVCNSDEAYKYSYYSFSFCSGHNAGDRLSQWRGYCQNGGFSFGLSRKMIKNQTVIDAVQYLNESNSNERIAKLIERCNASKNSQDFDNNFFGFIASCKHKSFEEENEIRALCPEGLKVKFKISNGVLKPYKELKIPKSALKQIIIGPSPNSELCELGLRMFLNDQRLEHVEIKRSEIPYRTNH